MIALKAIKYVIYDWCLDIITTKFSRNFLIGISNPGNKLLPYQIVPGMHIREIRVNLTETDTITYFNCIIKTMIRHDHIDNSYGVSFSAESIHGRPPSYLSGKPQGWACSDLSNEVEFFV